MIKYLLTTLLALFMATVPAAAKEDVDYGELELDKDYTFPNFAGATGTFTVPKDGMLVVSSTCSDFVTPFKDAEHSQRHDYTFSYDGKGGNYYDMKVAKGEKIYFYIRFSMNAGSFRLTMDEDVTLSATTKPEAGSVYTPSGGAQISVDFNKAVSTDGCEIQVGEHIVPVTPVKYGATFVFNITNEVYELMKEGKLAAGDPFTLRLKNVRLKSDESVIYGTDGTFEVQFIASKKPVALVKSEVFNGGNFLSFWPAGSEAAKLHLTFDGALLQSQDLEKDKIFALLSYGMNEGTDSELYTEKLPIIFTETTATVDFSGKLRRPIDMLPSGNVYPKAMIKLHGLRDSEGNYVYSAASGAVGTFSFSVPYEEIKVEFTPDFVPAANSSIKETNEIEIWTTDFSKLRFTGIRFSGLTTEGEKVEELVKDFRLVEDTEYEGAGSVFVKVEAMKALSNVTVALNELTTDDGIDHSSEFCVTYNTATTGIEDIVTKADKTLYTLTGIRVNKPTKRLPAGVYVVGGKKIMVK